MNLILVKIKAERQPMLEPGRRTKHYKFMLSNSLMDFKATSIGIQAKHRLKLVQDSLHLDLKDLKIQKIVGPIGTVVEQRTITLYPAQVRVSTCKVTCTQTAGLSNCKAQ